VCTVITVPYHYGKKVLLWYVIQIFRFAEWTTKLQILNIPPKAKWNSIIQYCENFKKWEQLT